MADKPDLVIYGNGNMAKMLFHYLKAHYTIKAFTVDSACIDVQEINGLPVIPFEDVENHYQPEQHKMIVAVGFVQMNRIRQNRSAEAKAKGYKLISYIHPSVSTHDINEIGENNIILENVSLHPYVKIGHNNFISANVNFGHGCIVHDNCWFNAGVSVAGEAVIHNNCFFGVNASVNNNIEVAEKTFIGANAFLSRSSSAGEVYLSEPGEKLRLNSDAFVKFMKVV